MLLVSGPVSEAPESLPPDIGCCLSRELIPRFGGRGVDPWSPQLPPSVPNGPSPTAEPLLPCSTFLKVRVRKVGLKPHAHRIQRGTEAQGGLRGRTARERQKMSIGRTHQDQKAQNWSIPLPGSRSEPDSRMGAEYLVWQETPEGFWRETYG